MTEQEIRQCTPFVHHLYTYKDDSIMYNQCTLSVHLVYTLNKVFNKGLLQRFLTKVYNTCTLKINFQLDSVLFFLFKTSIENKQAFGVVAEFLPTFGEGISLSEGFNKLSYEK